MRFLGEQKSKIEDRCLVEHLQHRFDLYIMQLQHVELDGEDI